MGYLQKTLLFATKVSKVPGGVEENPGLNRVSRYSCAASFDCAQGRLYGAHPDKNAEV